MTNAPAPWNLTGKGYIFLYKFDKQTVNESGFVPDFLKEQFVGGIGSVMIVDYETSNVGPYYELLLIPGQFSHKNKKLNAITKIYVSSLDSVENGKRNWGIPKELADFQFTRINDITERITVTIDKTLVLDAEVKTKGLRFPMNTKNLPISLVQKIDNTTFYTKFFGKGKATTAHLKHIEVNGDTFMNVSNFRPITALRLDPFDITFPVAQIEVDEA